MKYTDLDLKKPVESKNYKLESEFVCKYTLDLIPCYLTLLLLKYNKQFHKFDYRNKDIIMESIPKKYRPIINNIE